MRVDVQRWWVAGRIDMETCVEGRGALLLILIFTLLLAALFHSSPLSAWTRRAES